MELDSVRHTQVMQVLQSIQVTPNAINKASIATMPCHHIPYDRNPSFFARTSELKLCHATLLSTATAGIPRWYSLHGVGGVGKTSIALEFAYLNKDSQDVVLWLSADRPWKLDRAFVEIAAKMNLHVEAADSKADRSEILRFLSGTCTRHQCGLA
jgi:hypothetical protein